MSTCVIRGVTFNRHKWVGGICTRCGQHKSKERFEHELPLHYETIIEDDAQTFENSDVVVEGTCGCCGKAFEQCDCASPELDRDI